MSALNTTIFATIPTTYHPAGYDPARLPVKLRALRLVFKTAREALEVGKSYSDRKTQPSVVYSSHHLRDPKTGKRSRLYVVTVRPRSWRESEMQRRNGFGL